MPRRNLRGWDAVLSATLTPDCPALSDDTMSAMCQSILLESETEQPPAAMRCLVSPAPAMHLAHEMLKRPGLPTNWRYISRRRHRAARKSGVACVSFSRVTLNEEAKKVSGPHIMIVSPQRNQKELRA